MRAIPHFPLIHPTKFVLMINNMFILKLMPSGHSCELEFLNCAEKMTSKTAYKLSTRQ